MLDYCFGTNLIKPENYREVWTCRYFSREDIDHYLYEVVEKKDSTELAVRAYNCKGEFVKEIPADLWKTAYGSLFFINALTYKIGWCV